MSILAPPIPLAAGLLRAVLIYVTYIMAGFYSYNAWINLLSMYSLTFSVMKGPNLCVEYVGILRDRTRLRI